ncbi:UNVERIFIED_CONTAM: hypothetical protein GTU68_010396 [Idotea baltica]|nr:hypothetical protein [Idotea baltica]
MELSFFKYQGTGNDFILLDNRKKNWERLLSRESIAYLCDRRRGIGADGLMLLSDSEDADFRMIYYNSDGGESTMCGNGGRCIVGFAKRLGHIQDECTFDAIDGLHHAQVNGNEVILEMMKPKGFQTLADSKFWIDTGSPHYVWFTDKPIEEISVFEQGKKIRYHTDFQAIGGTNVNFVNIDEPKKLQVRTYERGVENETLSCGTGVTACAYTYLMQHPQDSPEIQINTPGGILKVEVKDMGTTEERVFLSGPATFVFQGKIRLP